MNKSRKFLLVCIVSLGIGNIPKILVASGLEHMILESSTMMDVFLVRAEIYIRQMEFQVPHPPAVFVTYVKDTDSIQIFVADRSEARNRGEAQAQATKFIERIKLGLGVNPKTGKLFNPTGIHSNLGNWAEHASGFKKVEEPDQLGREVDEKTNIVVAEILSNRNKEQYTCRSALLSEKIVCD